MCTGIRKEKYHKYTHVKDHVVHVTFQSSMDYRWKQQNNPTFIKTSKTKSVTVTVTVSVS